MQQSQRHQTGRIRFRQCLRLGEFRLAQNCKGRPGRTRNYESLEFGHPLAGRYGVSIAKRAESPTVGGPDVLFLELPQIL